MTAILQSSTLVLSLYTRSFRCIVSIKGLVTSICNNFSSLWTKSLSWMRPIHETFQVLSYKCVTARFIDCYLVRGDYGRKTFSRFESVHSWVSRVDSEYYSVQFPACGLVGIPSALSVTTGKHVSPMLLWNGNNAKPCTLSSERAGELLAGTVVGTLFESRHLLLQQSQVSESDYSPVAYKPLRYSELLCLFGSNIGDKASLQKRILLSVQYRKLLGLWNDSTHITHPRSS